MDKKKRPKIDKDIEPLVQAYANKHFNGNFTKAVNYLIGLSLDIPRA